MVEGFFASKHTSLRNQILSRYPGFIRNLLNSPSKEVRIVAKLVKDDPRSTTCKNLEYLRKVTNLGAPENYSTTRMKSELPVKEVPDNEKWRLGLLEHLFKIKEEKHIDVIDTKHVMAMIQSLCNT